MFKPLARTNSRSIPRFFVVALALTLAACQPTASNLPTPALTPITIPTTISVPTIAPAATIPAPTVTPAPTANPVATTTTITASRPVTFTTSDGATLSGTLYGQGLTAVIFSNRSDKGQASWTKMAKRAAAAGYLALTFDYRAWRGNGTFDLAKLNQADVDLLAAADFIRSQGAQSIALVGGSLGGIASAKDTLAIAPAALVIIGSPMSNPSLTIKVDPAELQNDVPKLFIASTDDSLVAAAETKAMYDQAAEPKTYFEYPGSAHATDLFQGPQAEDLAQKLLEFLAEHAPPQPAP